jgi:serpin B
MAMTYAGAEGATKEQMAEPLNFILEAENLHAAFNKLQSSLPTREGNKSRDEEGFKLSIANAIGGRLNTPSSMNTWIPWQSI